MRPTAATALFFMLWLFLLVVGRNGLFHDPGTFWHTRTGEIILCTGDVVRTDPFSITMFGKPWVAFQWLGELVMALLHRWGGLDALWLMSASILAALYAWLGQRLLRTGLHWSVAFALVAFGVLASASHFHARPHLATLVLLAIECALIAEVDAGRFSQRMLWWLVPGVWLWTQLHGGVAGGLATYALAVLGWGVFWWMGRPSPVARWSDVVRLILIGLFCGFAVLLNPYGWGTIETWRSIMASAVLPKIITEHRGLEFGEFDGIAILLFAVLYGTALCAAGPSRWRVAWLLPLAWFIQAVSRIRHGPLFALAGLVMLAAMLPASPWFVRLATTRPDLVHEPPPQRAWYFWPASAFTIAFALLPGSYGWVQLDPVTWPTELLPVIRDREPRTGEPEEGVFCECDWGGFLIYHTPNFRPTIDDRCELYGDDRLLAFVTAGNGDHTAEYLRTVTNGPPRVRFALVRAGQPFDLALDQSPAWRIVKRTPTAAFWERDAHE